MVGCGKGKLEQNCNNDNPKEIKYELKGSCDNCIFNGHKTTVGELVSKRRLTSEADEAHCCYHELIDNPSENDNVGFDLCPTQALFYVVSDGTALPKATQTAGSLIPLEKWHTTFTKSLWLMKWMPKKWLQPVRKSHG